MQKFNHIGSRQATKDLELFQITDMHLVVLSERNGIYENGKRREGAGKRERKKDKEGSV
jgi:hypothetical protein